MSETPTTMNGRIPPTVRKIALTEVSHVIGKGVDGDPFRTALSYYDEAGDHMWTFDWNTLLAFRNIPAPPKERG